MVQVDSLIKTFTDEAGPFNVLDGATFSIAQGEMVALVGESGAGKTTLLQIIGGLDSYTDGSVKISGQELCLMNENARALFRGKYIGFVFQFHHLLPDFTAIENLVIPGMIIGKSKKECLSDAKELLCAVGLEKRMTHLPSELSGGERQRVALARALFNKPALVLADEPTGNLDTRNSAMLLELFYKLNKEYNQTFLIATHNEHLSDNLHRAIFIEDGKIIQKS